jgi:hypothetical protein
MYAPTGITSRGDAGVEQRREVTTVALVARGRENRVR